MLRASLLAFSTLALGSGCIIKEEVKDGIRELISEVEEAELDAAPDGSGVLTFNYHYGLGIADDAGIEQVDWTYRLVDADRNVLGQNDQRMRKAEPDKTRILVEGDRKRELEIPSGVEKGRTYILFIEVTYRDELLGEFLHPVQSS